MFSAITKKLQGLFKKKERRNRVRWDAAYSHIWQTTINTTTSVAVYTAKVSYLFQVNNPKPKVGPNVIDTGTILWLDANGRIHREGDKPAIISPKGILFFMQHSVLHRDGYKPAYIDKSGYTEYWRQGIKVSED